MEDVDAAMDLVKTSMMASATDFTTGKVDMDKFETGIVHSKRSQLEIIEDAFRSIYADCHDSRGIPIDTLVDKVSDKAKLTITHTEKVIAQKRHIGELIENVFGYLRYNK